MSDTRRAPLMGRATLWSLMVGLVGVLVFASSASAARDPLVRGVADIHMKKGFLRKLDNNAIDVVGVGNGSVAGNRARVPSIGGKLDPTDGVGFIESGSGFKFQLGTRGVPVTKATFNTAKRAVYAVVARARMQFATIASFSATASFQCLFGRRGSKSVTRQPAPYLRKNSGNSTSGEPRRR